MTLWGPQPSAGHSPNNRHSSEKRRRGGNPPPAGFAYSFPCSRSASTVSGRPHRLMKPVALVWS